MVTHERFEEKLDYLPIIEGHLQGKLSKKEYIACCPFHDEKKPSFNINIETGLFRCFSCDESGNFAKFYSRMTGCSIPDSYRILNEMAGLGKVIDMKQGKEVDRFNYYDRNGKLLYYRIRVEPGKNGRKKDFYPVNPANGKLERPCAPVLYNLQDVVKAELVFICEGERKANVLKRWEYVGTCFDGGASSPINPEMVGILSNKVIIILPDNDEAGEKYKNNIIDAMWGKAEQIKVVSLPDLEEKGDIVDWVKIPGNDKELFNKILRETPVLTEWAASPPKKDLIDLVVSLDDLVKIDLPERENIVAPFLPAQSINMVFAQRGLGKTWFCIELALAVAAGRKFLTWDVPKSRRVLYIDGEMPLKMLKDRFKALSQGSFANIDILPSECLWLEGRQLNLNQPDCHRQVNRFLDQLKEKGRSPELIIFDNLSSMTSGSDENSNSGLDNMLQFFITLRHQGFAVMLVHHSGKGGDQRGASRREDLLDTSIKIIPPKGDEPPKGAKFVIEFSKTRGLRPNPAELVVELITGANGDLEWVLGSKVEQSSMNKLLIAIRDIQPKTQTELADYLGFKNQSSVSKQLKAAKSKGFVVEGKRGIELTVNGFTEANNSDSF